MNWKIAAATVAVIMVALAGTAYYIAGTPQYSLYLIRKAVREGDRDTFFQHFDTARVVSHAIAAATSATGIPQGPGIVSQKAVETLVPASDKIIRERIDERFDSPDAAPIMRMSIDSVAYQAQAAVVTLKDLSDGSTSKLIMTRLPNRHWKIIEIDLNKAGVEYSLKEARDKADELLPPEEPAVKGIQIPNMGQ